AGGDQFVAALHVAVVGEEVGGGAVLLHPRGAAGEKDDKQDGCGVCLQISYLKTSKTARGCLVRGGVLRGRGRARAVLRGCGGWGGRGAGGGNRGLRHFC